MNITFFRNSQLDELREQRLIFVSGKGGVGKTTIAENLVLEFLRRGLKVIHLTVNQEKNRSEPRAASSPFSSLAKSPQHYKKLNLTPAECFKEYLNNTTFVSFLSERLPSALLKASFLRDAVLESRLFEMISSATPGFREIVVAGKIFAEAKSEAWDKAVVDLPASGHALDFLKMPLAVQRMFGPGFVGKESRKIAEFFQDNSKTAIVVVGLAEELAARETVEMLAELNGELNMNCPFILINKLPGDLPSYEEIKELINRKSLQEFGYILANMRSSGELRLARAEKELNRLREIMRERGLNDNLLYGLLFSVKKQNGSILLPEILGVSGGNQ